MARPSNTAERRAQIVEALRQILGDSGYAGATTKAMAKRAGLSPGLVHYHFGSKAEVLLALGERISEDVLRRLATMDASASTPRQRVHAVLRAWLARGPDAEFATVAAWVAIGAEAVHEEDVAAVYRRLVDQWLELLGGRMADVLAAEGGDPSQAPGMALTLFAFVEGTFRLAAGTRVVREGSAASTAMALADLLLDRGTDPGRS